MGRRLAAFVVLAGLLAAAPPLVDGRLPPLTTEAAARLAENPFPYGGRSGLDSWEGLSLFERCIFTLDDPAEFVRPFTVAIPMRKTGGVLFEYACHEGNYGLVNALRSARYAERAER